MRGAGEERSESYVLYGELLPAPATKQVKDF